MPPLLPSGRSSQHIRRDADSAMPRVLILPRHLLRLIRQWMGVSKGYCEKVPAHATTRIINYGDDGTEDRNG